MEEPDFFTRNNLPASTRSRCHTFTTQLYPASSISPAPSQGYCSYTLFISPTDQKEKTTEPEEPLTVLQFRPPAHSLDITITDRAREVYGSLAPRVVYVGRLDDEDAGNTSDDEDPDAATRAVPRRATREDTAASPAGSPHQPLLHVYALSRIRGTSLADLRSGGTPYPAVELVRSFARFIARGLAHRRSSTEDFRRGLIGSSLRDRLEKMHAKLPVRFRPVVKRVLDSLERIEALPWVLTHGDVVPSNVMVGWEKVDGAENGESLVSLVGNDVSRRRRLEISGMLDWAEAEYLPFGVGLYGLEELLGEVVDANGCIGDDVLGSAGGGETGPGAESNSSVFSGRYPPASSTFEYYPEAEALRTEFWVELGRFIPELGTAPDKQTGDAAKKQFLEDVRLARQLGILLWHGIAFDDGRLDRVVEEGRDDEEVRRLDLFLLGSDKIQPTAENPHGRIWWRRWQMGGKPLVSRIMEAWMYLTRTVGCVLLRMIR